MQQDGESYNFLVMMAPAPQSVTYSYDRKNSSCVRNDVTKTYHSYHLLLYFKRRKLLRLCNTLMYDYRHAKWWAIRCAPLCAPTSTFWTTLWFCKSSTQNEEYKSYPELKITYIRFWIEPENVTYVRTWMSLVGWVEGIVNHKRNRNHLVMVEKPMNRNLALFYGFDHKNVIKNVIFTVENRWLWFISVPVHPRHQQ